MSKRRLIKVFIASPGDLHVERRAFKTLIDELNTGFGHGADVEFIPLGWEDALSTVGRRPQSVINKDIDNCDVFILVMWRRWGQEAPDAAPYSSYTEEEFFRALTRFEKNGSPTIFVFFKDIEAGQIADPGPQLTKVLEFRKRLEATKTVFARCFNDETGFRDEIALHLTAFAKGDTEAPANDFRCPLVPASILETIEVLREEVQRALQEAQTASERAKDAEARAQAAEQVAEARANTKNLELAKQAAISALEGNVESARQSFAKVLDGTSNLQILDMGFDFFMRIGEFDEAERLARRSLAISGPDTVSSNTASAYSNLGIMFQSRGEYDRAEQMLNKARDIEESLGDSKGICAVYGNLANIYYSRQELDRAEEAYNRVLAICEESNDTVARATTYGNLTTIYLARKDYESAENICIKSLELETKLGRLEGIADDYANLGSVYAHQMELDKAEEMYRKALVINEKLMRLKGIAICKGNLGLLNEIREDYEVAREYYESALSIVERIGMSVLIEKYRQALLSLPSKLGP